MLMVVLAAAAFWPRWTQAQPPQATPSIVERLADDVLVVRDDAGSWQEGSHGTTHQRGDSYVIRKTLDASRVDEAAWNATTQIRLSAFFCVHDYSWHDAKQANGLDETLELVVNGHVHRMADKDGLPVLAAKKSMASAMRWHDFAMPKEDFVRGVNQIEIRMIRPEGKTAPADDYLYLGIDNTVPTGNSSLRLGTTAKTPWRQDQVNTAGAHGEYMVRLYLLGGPRDVTVTWRTEGQRIDDLSHLLDYAGAADGTPRLEWNPARLDTVDGLSVSVETPGALALHLQWLDEHGEKLGAVVKGRGPRFETQLPASLAQRSGGLQFPKGTFLKSVTLHTAKGFRPTTPAVDMAPAISPPAGSPANRAPSCRIEGDKILLANPTLRCEFQRAGGRLRLVSLVNELAAAETVRSPDDCLLALVEVEGRRYAASRDFVCREVKPMTSRQGFTAALECPAAKVNAVLSVRIDQALRWGLSVTNATTKPLDMKVAFVHLSGLALSERPAEDYYFYPLGCVVSDAPALIRQGYGDHQALYQLMDLFSPKRGAGLAVWCTDDDGRYKVLALRKHVADRQPIMADRPQSPTANEHKWSNSLEAVPGVGMAYEYLRRTRAPGESFTAKEVAIEPHPGDWHVAVARYAAWCHAIWKYRPYPSRLTPALNMPAVGWGQDNLVRNGKYRDDFVKPTHDCIELMSWWNWSPVGPKGVPLDQFAQTMGEAKATMWHSYFVKDPTSGALMYNNNPGDYDGYNPRFGGLEALRAAIKSYQKAGHLVTLYTDPLRVDENTECGRRFGKLWGVVQPDGKYRDDYDAWRMCHDVAAYRQWVAQEMARAMRETGADGLRLDEYGHCGSACFNRLHEHTFAEPGCTEWQRSIAETSRLVHEAMDKVRPGLILTTEHPGYDFLMPWIDGCITYDLTVLASPLRPLECNLQRFYFPECKAFELDHRAADRAHRKRFWNAVGSFGSIYPKVMDRVLRENEDVFSGRDAQPLVPTRMQYVYANRFHAGEKTVVMLYNATGHSVIGPMVAMAPTAEEHVVELQTGKEISCQPGPGGPTATVFVARQDVACLACLKSRLAIQHQGGEAFVSVARPEARWQLAVCDREGTPLSTQKATEGRLTIRSEGVSSATAPAMVKLLDGQRLLDLKALSWRQ